MEKKSPIDVRREKAKKIYESWNEQGFKVEDVSGFYENNDSTKRRYETVISTPWVCKGKGRNTYLPVMAYALSVFPPERGDDNASFGETEVLEIEYLLQKNDVDLDNITSKLARGKEHLYNVDTKQLCEKEKSDDIIFNIIQIANNLPHVAMWEEFMSLEVVISARNGEKFDADARTMDYINDYLAHVEEGFLEPSEGIYVGKITSLRDIHYAYESIPKEDREIMMAEKAGCTVEEYLKKIM